MTKFLQHDRCVGVHGQFNLSYRMHIDIKRLSIFVHPQKSNAAFFPERNSLPIPTLIKLNIIVRKYSTFFSVFCSFYLET